MTTPPLPKITFDTTEEGKNYLATLPTTAHVYHDRESALDTLNHDYNEWYVGSGAAALDFYVPEGHELDPEEAYDTDMLALLARTMTPVHLANRPDRPVYVHDTAVVDGERFDELCFEFTTDLRPDDLKTAHPAGTKAGR